MIYMYNYKGEYVTNKSININDLIYRNVGWKLKQKLVLFSCLISYWPITKLSSLSWHVGLLIHEALTIQLKKIIFPSSKHIPSSKWFFFCYLNRFLTETLVLTYIVYYHFRLCCDLYLIQPYFWSMYKVLEMKFDIFLRYKIY